MNAATDTAVGVPAGGEAPQNVGVKVQDAAFWQALQVYPAAIAHEEAKDDYQNRAMRTLSSMSLGNLFYICDRLDIPYRVEAETPQSVAWRLMQSSGAQLLNYLTAYLKSHTQAIVEHYDNRFPQHETQKIQASVLDRGGRQQNVKPLTKLLAIYLRSPADLESIHFRSAWRKSTTLAEYDIEGALPDNPATALAQGMDDLVKMLGNIKASETYVSRGFNRLQRGLDVFILHRNYPASVRPDYRSKFRLQHDSGRVVFGLDVERKTLIIKVGNKAIAKEIAAWFKATLSVELEKSGGKIYSNYDSSSVSRNILGSYDESYGVDLVSIEFRYSSLPAASPMIITAAEHNRSIREELVWLREHGVLKLTSLADLKSLTVRFDGITTQIACIPEKGGAIHLKMNDVGLEEKHKASLKKAFHDAFQVPLEQQIDPTVMVMGSTEIYHFLLGGVDEHQVRSYQREHLVKLLDNKVLKEITVKTGNCSNPACLGYQQRIDDASASECQSCQSSIRWREHKRYVRDEKEVSKAIKRLFQSAINWRFSTEPRKFEGFPFYRFRSESSRNKMVYVFLNDRLTAIKVETFQRTMFPILVIHPTGNQRAPVIDSAGLAHVGLPCTLAALEGKQARKQFRQALFTIIRRLLQMEHERVMASSRLSRDLLDNKPADYDEWKFEADVYNVIRRLLPYSFKWGGQNKPDGFLSFIDYAENDLKKPLKYNFSYDAKYSKTTYDFAIKEYRQMFDYILALGNSNQLKAEGNQYDGHIIISNDIDESSMKGASDFLWSEHRLGSTRPSFWLVFMRDRFLAKAWDMVHDRQAEIAKRWMLFPQALMRAIKDNEINRYSLLDEEAAVVMMNWLLRQPAIENPLNNEFLLDDLTHLIGMRARIRKRAADPSRN